MKRIIPILLSVLLSVNVHAAEQAKKAQAEEVEKQLADSLGVLFYARRLSGATACDVKGILPYSPLVIKGRKLDLKDEATQRQVDLAALKAFFETDPLDAKSKQALLDDVKNHRTYAPLTEQERKSLMAIQGSLATKWD